MISFIKELFRLMKPKRWVYFTSLALSAVSIIIALISSTFISKIVDKGIVGNDQAALVKLLIVAFSVICGKVVIRFFMSSGFHLASAESICRLRTRLFHNLEHLDGGFFRVNPAGDLMNRFIGDIENIYAFLTHTFFIFFEILVQFPVAVIYLCTVNLTLGLIMIAVVPVILFFALRLMRTLRPIHAESREAQVALNTAVKENIDGMRTVKAFAREDGEIEKMTAVNTRLRDANLAAAFANLRCSTPINFLTALMSGIAVIGGAYFCIQGQLTIGEITLFTNFIWALANPLILLPSLTNEYQLAATSANKILPLYYAAPSVTEAKNALPISEIKEGIVFENASLRLGGRDLLSGVSFTVKPGQTVALMGPTGSGKSILLGLLLRFYDLTGGSILIDGHDIRAYKLDDLRRLFAPSFQEAFLFSDTIENNLLFADENGDAVEAAKTAAADSFIRRTPDGYGTIVGERGVGLSGGQRQRISLARALAAKRQVLLLDDTTSAVDMETEKIIQENLAGLSCTKFIVAQRISSVYQADLILILEKGRITQAGDHKALREQPGYYRSILQIQHPEEVRS